MQIKSSLRVVSDNFIYLIAIVCLFLFFTTCKKSVPVDTISNSGIKYLDGRPNDKVNTISKTADGGFIYSGYTGNEANHTDAFLMKVDAGGNQQWYKTFGGKTYDEFNYSIQTSDGGFLSVGVTNSFGQGPLDNSFVLYDYIVKTDANGHEIWSQSILTKPCLLNNAYENAAHEYILTGAARFSNDADILILKLAENGDFIWGYSYYPPAIPPKLADPNNYNDYGQFVGMADDGDIIIAGVMSKSDKSLEVSKLVPYLMKVSNNTGNPVWFYPYYNFVSEKNYYSSWDDPHYRRPYIKVCNLSDGYLAGTYIELPGNKLNILLIKTNLTGEIQWSKQYQGLGNAVFHNIEAQPDGSFLILGMSTASEHTNSFPEKFQYLKTMLLKVDKDGNQIWTNYIGGETNANISKCMQTKFEKSWNLAGYTCITETGFDKMYFLKTDKSGNMIK